MRLAAQKQTKYSMLQLKTIPKNISTLYILNLLIYLLLKLSEEVTKHTHARYNFPSL